MPEEKEVPEFYSDQLMISGGPYGVTISFAKSPGEPGPGRVPETGVRVRMSYEHLKCMTFILWRHIRKIEKDTGVAYPVPTKVLSDLGVGLEDWQSFWQPT